jgi:hypothetical protein
VSDPSDLDPSDHPVEGSATIFVSDPSAEADRLSTALRGRGYTVIDVPLSLLVARVAVQTPSLILLDIDAEGALDVASRLREIPGAQGIDILFLGEEGKTFDGPNDALRQEGSGFLERPVDVQALLRKVDTLVGARGKEVSSRNPLPPSSVRLDRPTPSSGRGPRSPLPEAWSERPGPLPPADDGLGAAFGAGAPAGSKLPLPALSPEIEKLLQGAEDRSAVELGPASQALPASEPPSPDEEVDAVLPAEVLAALDEPLDENDDDLQSDSGLSTGAPRKSTTGSPDVITSSGSAAAAGDNAPTAPPKRPVTVTRQPDNSQPPPFSHPPPDAGDPKELETPRPPRRSPASAAPPPQVPPPAPPPRELRSSTIPPSVHPPASSGAATVPPGPMSRIARGSAPPSPMRAPGVPSLEPMLPEARPTAGTVPPAHPTSPPATSPTNAPPMSEMGQQPATPRSIGPAARRPESVPPSSSNLADGAVSFQLPEELGLGDALSAFAICVRERATGALVIDAPEGVRRILLRDGDVVTAASGLDEESLVSFLGTRGDISREVSAQLHGKIPAFGRHAGAALVANGHLNQDQLWPVLRAHAEWVLSCAICAEKGTASFELNPPGRLKAEPSVFGGATGSEVLIEVVRRAVPAEVAVTRLGGGGTRLNEGARFDLLSECALPEAEQQWLNRSKGAKLDDALGSAPHAELAPVAYALVQLGVITTGAVEAIPRKKRSSGGALFDPIDAQAVRSQVKARLSLVEEGDYFSLLGVPRTATAYEIHRAYLELRRGFEPSRVLNAATADLADDLDLIIEVLEEAHDILRDQARRERYRRAIEDKPPA